MSLARKQTPGEDGKTLWRGRIWRAKRSGQAREPEA